MSRYKLHNGDCIEVMSRMLENSVDAIVTDPPYELGFMGKKWDSTGIAFNTEVWKQALRVLKPGGHLLAFSGSRTYHRMAVAIEDAGFEIRDQIMWIYGSGFPKSLDVSKAIDKAAGAEREVVGTRRQRANSDNSLVPMNASSGDVEEITAPATDEAKQWQGWGTALKPAHEPIVLARKPLIGTVAENVMTYGTGGLNIEESRISSDDGFEKAWDKPVSTNISAKGGKYISEGAKHTVDLSNYKPSGRWPANVIHDGLQQEWARFFYCAKANKRDRNEGLDGFENKIVNEITLPGTKGANSPRAGAGRNGATKNFHPTVKPTDLMAYLCRLVTARGGVILDPFMGSGSTGKAAMYEGFRFIGIEQSAEYLDIAKARIEFALENQ